MEPARFCTAEVSRTCWEPLGLDGQNITAVAATPFGVFAGGSRDGVFRLDSASGSWLPLGLDHAWVSSILYVPGDTGRVLVGMTPFGAQETEAAVFATEDGGQSWMPWDGGRAQEQDRRFWAFSLAIDPGDPKRLFMGSVFAILRSTDGGRTWEVVDGRPDDQAGGVNSIVVSPRRDGNMWAAGQTAFSRGIIRHSRDWGDSWEPFLVNVITVFDLALDPWAPGTLWAAAPGGVMSSDDAGETWQIRLKGLIAHGMVFLEGGAYVFGGEEPEIRFPGELLAFFSPRGPQMGDSWVRLATPNGVRGATSTVAVDAQRRVLFGTGGSGVWRYTP